MWARKVERVLEHLIDAATEGTDLRFDTDEVFMGDEDWKQLYLQVLAGVSPADVAGEFQVLADEDEHQVRASLLPDGPGRVRYEVERLPDVCEHGLSAWLCRGPNHYPEDGDY